MSLFKLKKWLNDEIFFKQLRIIIWGGTREISFFLYFSIRSFADSQK